MRRLLYVVLVVLVLVAAAALALALGWRTLLSPEQQLSVGLYFRAGEDVRRKAAAAPDDSAALDAYVERLVAQGNIGRALYLVDLHGASAPAGLDELREELQTSARRVRQRQVHRVSQHASVEPYLELPLGQALLYLEGFQHAVLGDWASARNHFNAIEPRQLAPALRANHLYYLARSYRLAGTPEEQEQIESLYEQLLARADASEGMKSRARYNLAAWYLSQEYTGDDGLQRATALRGQIDAESPAQRWAAQKLDTELAQHHWERREEGGAESIATAWDLALASVRAAPEDLASLAAGELLLLIARTEMEATPGQFALPLPAGALADLASSLTFHGYFTRTGALSILRELDARLPAEHDAEMLLAQAQILGAAGDIAGMRALIGTPRFNSQSAATRGAIRFEYAEMLARGREWNAALGQYRAVTELGGPREAEALYARYAVLKDVQSPLNLDTAVPLLQAVAQRFPSSSVAPKCIEELLPLLIYRGRRAEARELAEHAVADDFGDVQDAAGTLAFANLRDVARFWLAYLDGEEHLSRIERGTWNYYEVVAVGGAPPEPRPDALYELLARPESAGEYLAGLGQFEAAREDFADLGYPDDPLLLYHTLRVQGQTQGLPAAQWNAMQLLESGRIREPAVMAYALEQAYPLPYREEVDAAAAESGMDPALIYAVMKKESDFKPEATSGVGAQGLMQLMPPTARMLSGRGGIPADAHRRLGEPAINIRLGAAYLSHLSSQLGAIAPAGPSWAGSGDNSALKRAMLHSYNAGPGNYGKWRGLYPQADAVLLADLVPNEENEGFAKRVWKYYVIYKGRLSQ